METIKFRIYNPERKKMIEGGATPTMLSSFFENTATLNTVHKMKYQQFTGLLDKHDKEIYEGDIVDATKKGFPKNIGQIIWESMFAGFQVLDSENDRFDIDDVEIVGNIYENKNLL